MDCHMAKPIEALCESDNHKNRERDEKDENVLPGALPLLQAGLPVYQ